MKITRNQLRKMITEQWDDPMLAKAYASARSGFKADERERNMQPLEYGVPPRTQVDAYRPGESVLTDIASAIEEIIYSNVGRIDLDYSDDPLTREDILDFVVRMLHEQR